MSKSYLVPKSIWKEHTRSVFSVNTWFVYVSGGCVYLLTWCKSRDISNLWSVESRCGKITFHNRKCWSCWLLIYKLNLGWLSLYSFWRWKGVLIYNATTWSSAILSLSIQWRHSYCLKWRRGVRVLWSTCLPSALDPRALCSPCIRRQKLTWTSSHVAWPWNMSLTVSLREGAAHHRLF